VDVDFKIEEGPGAQLSGGLGYSELYKLTLNGNYTDANFLGSGERISVDLSGGAYNKVYSVSQTNPYTTIDGLVRTVTVSYRDISQFISSSSQFSTKILTAGLNYSYPITEYQFVTLGANLENAQLVTISGSSALQAQEWVQENGSPYSHAGGIGSVYNPVLGAYVTSAYQLYGTRFTTGELVAGWSFDSRNKTIFPDHGRYMVLSVLSTPPVGSVEYYKVSASFLQYIPLPKKFTLSLSAIFGYGNGLGKTTSLPPFQLYYGGGPDSVRGFREGFLGPRDQFGNPYGGNENVLLRSELLLPLPDKIAQSARMSLFYDMGNVFSTGNHPTFYAPPIGYSYGVTVPGEVGSQINYHFSYDNLKQSTGIAVQWLAPLGLFRFSFGFPINAKREVDNVTWGDETERFQFSVGQAF
jgi:outer membrane protein insertion porin family